VLPPAVKAEFRAVHTLASDTNSLVELHRVLRHLTERLGNRLRARHLAARRMTVHLAYTDYTTAKRSVPLGFAALDVELWEAARRAFALAQQRTVAVRAVGVVVDRFLEADLQLELWTEVPSSEYRVPGTESKAVALGTRSSELGTEHRPHPREAALQSALDRIRTRWGTRGVKVG
jgi:hypothetical protein